MDYLLITGPLEDDFFSHPASSSDPFSTKPTSFPLPVVGHLSTWRQPREPKQTPSCQSALYHNITTFTTKLETVVLQPFVQLNRQQCQKNNNKTNHKTVYISWYTIAFFSQQSFTSRQCAANKARDLKTHFLCLHKNTFKKSPKQWSQNPHKQEILKHQHLTVLQKSYIPINIFTDLTFIFFYLYCICCVCNLNSSLIFCSTQTMSTLSRMKMTVTHLNGMKKPENNPEKIWLFSWSTSKLHLSQHHVRSGPDRQPAD